MADARLLARPIPQEYDAFTVEELGVNPANQFGNLTDSGSGNLANHTTLWKSQKLVGGNQTLA